MITVDLKTAMIAKECFIKFIKLILEGPKYLVPLTDGDDDLSEEGQDWDELEKQAADDDKKRARELREEDRNNSKRRK